MNLVKLFPNPSEVSRCQDRTINAFPYQTTGSRVAHLVETDVTGVVGGEKRVKHAHVNVLAFPGKFRYP